MVNYLNKLLGTILVFLFLTRAVIAAEITATVDRNPIPVGESFQFILDARGSIDEDPDFSELNKIFRIISRSQSSNFRLINGSITRNKTWTLVLIGEDPGTYTIPAINFGKDKSEAISIKIVKNTIKQGADQQKDIFLEIDIEPKIAYVQQQIIYSIKLFRRIRLSNASLSEPVSENNQAIITKLGDDTDKKIAINGIAYSVLERRYAIFPQKSGKLKISPVNFETQIVNNTRQRLFSNMDPFSARTSIKRLKSKAIEIQVKGIPVEFTNKYPDASWLPVDSLTITEAWSGDISKFKSGEPMTRTISLTAQNLTAAQLPDIKFNTPKNIKTYPDVPVITEQNNNKGLIANKQFKTALLPTKIGKHKLSKIVIPWWNTNTNSIEESSLPAQIINVGATSNQSENNKLDLNTDLLKQQVTTSTKEQDKSLEINSPGNNLSEQSSPLMWIIFSAIFALLWLITIYLFLKLNAKYKALTVTSDKNTDFSPVSSKEIKNACFENNARACSQLLLAWANNNTESDRFTNLSALLPYTWQGLKIAIEELEQYLYSKKSIEWNGAQLWQAFKTKPPAFTIENNQNSSDPSLASLYAKYD
ncbi:MAG: BatD family protein [Thiohalomonadales bacterium]